jgi:mannose-6-phosphate isomerase-like protein (cupin superfamily)
MIKKTEKPWGYELLWAHTDKYVGKILFIKSGESLSLQYHKKKDETIFILKGKMNLEIKKNGRRMIKKMSEGQSFHIKPSVIHRMSALTDCYVCEVSTPELEDVVRLEDKYGRVKS